MDGLPVHALSLQTKTICRLWGIRVTFCRAGNSHWSLRYSSQRSQKSSKNDAKVEEDEGTAKARSFLESIHSDEDSLMGQELQGQLGKTISWEDKSNGGIAYLPIRY